MSDIYLVVENGYNTSYIDSLLIALFYRPTNIENLLNHYSEDSEFNYIQDMIKYNFIDLVRRRYSIGSEILNEIRNYCVMCNWKYNENIIDLFDVNDFYAFYINGIKTGHLLFETINAIDQKSEQKTLPYIEVVPDDDIYRENILSTMVTQWIDTTLLNKTDNIESTQCYHFSEIPILLPIYINRKKNSKLLTQKINIMKKIKLKHNNNVNQEALQWTIQSVICCSEINPHYYTLFLLSDNEWYLYDSTLKPSLYKIDHMTKEDFSNKIKQECVFVLYYLDYSQ